MGESGQIRAGVRREPGDAGRPDDGVSPGAAGRAAAASLPGVTWHRVACPLCGADEPRHLVTDTVRIAGDRYAFTIVRCEACGFEYTSPRALGTTFGALPGGAARRDAAVANGTVYGSGLARLGELGLPGGGRILDVGCARGEFLAFAAALGYHVTGVDINPRLAAEAAARGFDVREGDLRDLTGLAGFDAVTLWDVIEHVDDPVGLLAACREAVQPGGLVLLHTGNARFQIPKARLLALLRPDGGPYLIPYQHLSHFDPDSARRALALAGLAPLAVFFAGTLHYREAWKRAAMGAVNAMGALSARLGGPLLTNAMAAVGTRPPA